MQTKQGTMENNRQEAIEKLRDLIKGIDLAMLTTIDGGVMRSRPMSTQQVEFDGDLWFLTDRKTHKIDELQKDGRVGVSYTSSAKNTFVSVSGTAEVLRDQQKIDELWQPSHKFWFPEGKDDPDIMLLTVTVEQAEYWELSTGMLVHIYSFLKSMVTGARPDDSGDSTKLKL
jgi:general stress protein 26